MKSVYSKIYGPNHLKKKKKKKKKKKTENVSVFVSHYEIVIFLIG